MSEVLSSTTSARGTESQPVTDGSRSDLLVASWTPARLLAGRTASSYRTATSLELRRDHAAAVDAVHANIDLLRDFGVDLVQRLQLFEVCTLAISKSEFLARPELGRRLSEPAKLQIRQRCPRDVDLQVVIGDGLSATAVARQCPRLLPELLQEAADRDWKVGQPFLVRHCRVGVLNELGPLVSPQVAVLLIGERPGLATAESLSAYMAFRPQPGDTDARRNLISNIHQHGVPHEQAVSRILNLAERLMRHGQSGVAIKEEFPAAPLFISTGSH